jgi:hypothetical protein
MMNVIHLSLRWKTIVIWGTNGSLLGASLKGCRGIIETIIASHT